MTSRKRFNVVTLLMLLACSAGIVCVVFLKWQGTEKSEQETQKKTVENNNNLRSPESLSEKKQGTTIINLPKEIDVQSDSDEIADMGEKTVVAVANEDEENTPHSKEETSQAEETTSKEFSVETKPTLTTNSDKVDNKTSLGPKDDIATEANAATSLEAPNDNQIQAHFASQEYLMEADELIERAMSAILDEYGQGPLDYKSNETNPMFEWNMVDLEVADRAPDAFQKRGTRGNGGWTSQRSWKGLALRLIHALSKKSDFTVVLGGHSAAAGHGNHFHQSYMMQFHKVMAPVFGQLGVNLIARNMAQGGLGTIHSSMGSSSI